MVPVSAKYSILPQVLAPDNGIFALTGQSSGESCLLPSSQSRFLKQMAAGARTPLLIGFPWHKAYCGTRDEPHLVMASLRNATQFLQSLLSKNYRQECQALVLSLLNNQKWPVLVTGSCGSQIVAAALREVTPEEKIPPFLWISLGEVAAHRLDHPQVCKVHIRGTRDWISRIFSKEVDHDVNCGHLDYWTNPEVLEICQKAAHDYQPPQS